MAVAAGAFRVKSSELQCVSTEAGKFVARLGGFPFTLHNTSSGGYARRLYTTVQIMTSDKILLLAKVRHGDPPPVHPVTGTGGRYLLTPNCGAILALTGQCYIFRHETLVLARGQSSSCAAETFKGANVYLHTVCTVPRKS